MDTWVMFSKVNGHIHPQIGEFCHRDPHNQEPQTFPSFRLVEAYYNRSQIPYTTSWIITHGKPNILMLNHKANHIHKRLNQYGSKSLYGPPY